MAVILTDDTFKTQVEMGKGLALVDFYADWCVPCRQMMPVVESLSVDYSGRVLVCKLDTDKYADIAVKYGVASIPSLILFKDGKKVDESIGYTDKSELESMLAKYL